MTEPFAIGYTLMTEQSGPRELVGYAAAAERAGFDFEVSSDHYFPWLAAQGHSPYAWSVLGAVAQVTERVELMSYVTCPIGRYHPAIVAQKAATMALLSEGRFTLGLGAGENLNEHVIGEPWPAIDERHDRLAEAIEIIRRLFDGGLVTHAGRHFRVDSARLWDLPEQPVRIGVAVSGRKSVARFAPLGDDLIAVEPQADLVKGWNDARDGTAPGGSSRAIGQLAISWDADRDAAIDRAHEQFRWSGVGWPVNANLPTTEAFTMMTASTTPDEVAAKIPCGDDVRAVVEAVETYRAAGFTHLALVQIGGEPAQQQSFLEAAESELLPALREASGSRQAKTSRAA
jgi:G6PDH family F420-dependent oxidoreductase